VGGDADNGGPNARESINQLSPSPGTYYLVVDSTSLGNSAPACGAYVLNFSTIITPVELRNFSVD
jgi:hypothetical protein